MNLYQQLISLTDRHTRAAATLTTDLGGGTWQAQTQSGRTVILRGQGEAGRRVFYDAGTGSILAPAPDSDISDIAV
ncbi:Uncharacterised protein [Kingella potus]|uniref:Uncharacterized protein n=1 Tax=Kingella potus TaxID=265175 RepID=A0A377QYB5_9NEIS|nr:hypothetical protein [Kingella potus]STQ99859.1 Uncharacterised protein [Kingella potus]STR02404.1 Uncharacterised protein [Kingella potus]